MPGIADYRIKAARSGEYGGKSEPEFGPDVTARLGNVTVTYPTWCRVTVRRIVQGQAREFVANERWLENYATAGRDTEAPNTMWKKRAYGQLAKCAESQALRMAFPEFSAGYTAEEMEGRDAFDGQTIEQEPIRPTAMPRQPTVTEPPKRTRAQFLDGLEIALRDAVKGPNAAEAVDRIVGGDEVQRAMAEFRNGHIERLNQLIADAKLRSAPSVEKTPESIPEDEDIPI